MHFFNPVIGANVAFAALAMAAPADLRGGGVGCVTHPVKFCELNKLWIEMIDLIYVKMDTAAAYNNFVSENYTQHNPYVLSGWQNGLTALQGFFTPAINATILNQGIQGTVGYVHWRLDQADMAPTAVVDIYRWEGSCVVEHWDVMQALPDNAPNPLALW